MSQINITLLVFGLLALNFFLGWIPIAVTAISGVLILWLTGILTLEEAFGSFSSTTVIMLTSMCVLSNGLLRTNLMNHIRGLAKRSKGSEPAIILVGILVTVFLNQFMNTVVALLSTIPLLIAIADEVGIKRSRIIFPVSAVSHVFVSMFPIATGLAEVYKQNGILSNLGSTAQYQIWDLAFARLPAVIAITVYMVFAGYKLMPKDSSRPYDESMFDKDVLKTSELSRPKEILAYSVFCLTLLGMMFATWLPFNATQIGVTGALIMVASGVLPEKEAYKSMSWSTIFLVAGLLPLSTALTKTGAGDVIGQWVSNLLGGTTNIYVILTVVYLLTVALTQFLSNTATQNVIIPLAAVTAANLGLNPLSLVATAAIAAAVSVLTPMASPGMAITYDMGGYSLKDTIKGGLPVIIIVGVVLVIWLPMLFPVYL